MTQNNQLVPIQMGGHLLGRQTADGRIEAVRGVIALSEKQGEFVDISGRAMTTKKGLDKLNTIAGVSIITPERVVVPVGDQERTMVNPYPIIDPQSSSISKVWVRKIAIGYSPIGNLVVTSASLLYDIRMYFVQDLMKKVLYNADAGRVCMEFMLTEEEKQVGMFQKIEGEMGIYVRFAHKEVLKAIDTYINKKQFAERNAQTICERLVMAKHPALTFPYVDAYANGQPKQRIANIDVWGFRSNFSKEQLLDIAAQAERGEEIRIGDTTVQYHEVSATEEEMAQMGAVEQEADEFQSRDHSDLEEGIDF